MGGLKYTDCVHVLAVRKTVQVLSVIPVKSITGLYMNLAQHIDGQDWMITPSFKGRILLDRRSDARIWVGSGKRAGTQRHIIHLYGILYM